MYCCCSVYQRALLIVYGRVRLEQADLLSAVVCNQQNVKRSKWPCAEPAWVSEI